MITVFCTLSAIAQISVGGTRPTEGAIIDMNSTHTLGGLVLSNVWLDKVTHIPGNNRFVGIPNELDTKDELTGMVVWNTNKDVTGGNGVGPYVWDGKDWKCLGCRVRLAYVDVTKNGPNKGNGFDGTLNGDVRGYPAKGKIITRWIEFMPYNLGANDRNIKGDLYYQWGRNSDGHENKSSTTTSTLVNAGSYTPGHSSFITNNVNTVGDWITIDASNNPYPGRWGGSLVNSNAPESAKGVNDPCPSGSRVPTINEWAGIFAGGYNGGGEIGTFSDTSYNGKYEGANKWVYTSDYKNTGTAGWLVYPPKVKIIDGKETISDEGYENDPVLFLPVTSGFRLGANATGISGGGDKFGKPGGDIVNQSKSYYWSSSSTSSYKGFAQGMIFYKDGSEFKVGVIGAPRADGLSVRCIKY
ncbi:MAG: hypothetical protein LBQ84_02255 [Flavobacteriaceae bacterium]|nr:hypothetical protein [Flavobacteriaceae bacterium]